MDKLNIRKIIAAMGITQWEFSHLLDVSLITVKKWVALDPKKRTYPDKRNRKAIDRLIQGKGISHE